MPDLNTNCGLYFVNLYWCFQVTCAVLQLINEVVKDNTEFQENACLVGIVSSSILLQSAQIV